MGIYKMGLFRKLFFIASIVKIATSQDDESNLTRYNDVKFAAEVPKLNHLVMFYTPWCDHCQLVESTLQKLSKALEADVANEVKIAKVDCSMDSSLCSQHDITGYPTLTFFKVGESKGIQFKETHDLPSINAFVKAQLNKTPQDNEVDVSIPEAVNGLFSLTAENFDNHIAKGYHFVKFYAPWCGHCQKLAPTWDDLADSHKHDTTVSISKVDCTKHRSVCEQFEIKGYPTLLWIENGKKVDKYTGSRSHENLKEYISNMLKNNLKETDEKVEKKNEVEAVLNLTGETFDQGIEKGIVFVKFYAPWCGYCKRLSPTWDDLGKKFISNPNVRIVKVDCTLNVNKKLCDDQLVNEFPTLFLYKDGNKEGEYNGSRELEDLYEFVSKHISSHDEL